MTIIIRTKLLFFLMLGITLSQQSQALDTNHLIAECSQCHGSNGVSMNPGWPNLAGQKQGYLERQLKAFKSGERKNALMAVVIAKMSEEQISEVAKYYSSQPFTKAQSASINKAGQNVRARCVSCHSMTGRSVNNTWPNLAGQNGDYLYKQLVAFKEGTRKHMLMNVIASELTDQEMKDVAQYYEQQAFK